MQEQVKPNAHEPRPIQLLLKTIRFGIEIEVCEISRVRAAYSVGSVLNLPVYDRYGNPIERDGHVQRRSCTVGDWRIIRDASVDSFRSAEVISPPLTFAYIPVVQSICRQLRRDGARTNQTCGIHVHVDGSTIDEACMRSIINLWVSYQDHIFESLQVSENRKRQFCRPIRRTLAMKMNGELQLEKPQNMVEMNVVWYGRYRRNPDRYDASKYHAVNLNSYWFNNRKTIEFRLFNGTLHAGVVKSYIHLALGIMARCASRNIPLETLPMETDTIWETMREFLFLVGLSGEEFRVSRYHLLRHAFAISGVEGENPDLQSIESVD